MNNSILSYLEQTKDILNKYQIFNNNLIQVLGAALLFLVLSYLLPKLIKYLAERFDSISYGVLEQVGDAVSITLLSTSQYFIYFISLYYASGVLTLVKEIDQLFSRAAVIVVTIQIAIWLDTAIMFIVKKRFTGGEEGLDNSHKTSSYWLVSFIMKVTVWALAILLLLDNLGINISALVAGLGVGGIAVALAVQNILGDLFCSLSILLDKPFEVGDFIVVGPIKGNVEKIGIKSTRIRALSGEQIVVANSDLIKSQVQNFKRMNERRILFQLGVTYQTSSENLKKIPALLKEIVSSDDRVRFDRGHFFSFGDSALQFEVVYYVLSSEYNIFMDIQQEIYFNIFEKFNAMGIDFAYPTQTLFVEKGA